MSNLLLTGINLIAALIVFVHCVCRLSVRQWTFRQPELWAHALLTGGAVGVIGVSLARSESTLSAGVWINSGMAAYFLSQSWRLWRMKRGQK